jgi:hypothetical protein
VGATGAIVIMIAAAVVVIANCYTVGGDLPLRRGASPFMRRQLPRFIIHAANAMSTEPVSVTDHSIASRPKKRLAPIPFSPCVFTPS